MTLAQAYLIHQTTNRTLPCGLIDYIHRCGNLGINRLIVMCKIRQEIFFNDLNPSPDIILLTSPLDKGTVKNRLHFIRTDSVIRKLMQRQLCKSG